MNVNLSTNPISHQSKVQRDAHCQLQSRLTHGVRSSLTAVSVYRQSVHCEANPSSGAKSSGSLEPMMEKNSGRLARSRWGRFTATRRECDDLAVSQTIRDMYTLTRKVCTD